MQIVPRGNLETIHPRLLMLSHVHSLVKSRDYYAAFSLLRSHKLDMNLLFDLDPEYFLAHTEEVARKIGRPDYLGLLLQHLNPETSPWLEQFVPAEEI